MQHAACITPPASKPHPTFHHPCSPPQVQEVVAGGPKLEWAGLCVSQAQGVVPGYSQIKVPVIFSPTVEGEPGSS